MRLCFYTRVFILLRLSFYTRVFWWNMKLLFLGNFFYFDLMIIRDAWWFIILNGEMMITAKLDLLLFMYKLKKRKNGLKWNLWNIFLVLDKTSFGESILKMKIFYPSASYRVAHISHTNIEYYQSETKVAWPWKVHNRNEKYRFHVSLSLSF